MLSPEFPTNKTLIRVSHFCREQFLLRFATWRLGVRFREETFGFRRGYRPSETTATRRGFEISAGGPGQRGFQKNFPSTGECPIPGERADVRNPVPPAVVPLRFFGGLVSDRFGREREMIRSIPTVSIGQILFKVAGITLYFSTFPLSGDFPLHPFPELFQFRRRHTVFPPRVIVR